MGMLDSQLIFSEGQAVTATGDTPCTTPWKAANQYLGDAGQTNENHWVQAFCSTTAVGAGASAAAVLQDSADGVGYTDVVAGNSIGVASVTAGKALLAVQPPPGMRQWWRVTWRV